MPYNKNLEIPQLKNEQDGTCTYTHNHAIHYSYKCSEWTPETRKAARAFMEEGKREIKRCVFFMKNCLKVKNLSGTQQATLKQSIKNDEDLIKELDEAKPSQPSSCTIM